MLSGTFMRVSAASPPSNSSSQRSDPAGLGPGVAFAAVVEPAEADGDGVDEGAGVGVVVEPEPEPLASPGDTVLVLIVSFAVSRVSRAYCWSASHAVTSAVRP